MLSLLFLLLSTPPEPAVTNGQAANGYVRQAQENEEAERRRAPPPRAHGPARRGSTRSTRSRGPLCPLIFPSSGRGRAGLDPYRTCSYCSICVQRFACHIPGETTTMTHPPHDGTTPPRPAPATLSHVRTPPLAGCFFFFKITQYNADSQHVRILTLINTRTQTLISRARHQSMHGMESRDDANKRNQLAAPMMDTKGNGLLQIQRCGVCMHG